MALRELLVSALPRPLLTRFVDPPMQAQGRHPDPAVDGPVLPEDMPAERRALLDCEEMRRFREVLLLPGVHEVRGSVLGDLQRFTGFSEEECLQRCLDWEQYSIQEWSGAKRDSPAAVQDFYEQARSWCFDLLWYAYLQTEGHGQLSSVRIARHLGDLSGRRHMDLGSGAGVTCQLFAALGADSHLADVSPVLLAFAQDRLATRGSALPAIDLRTQPYPDDLDVVTAIDVFAHVTDMPATAAALARAVVPGGLLFANFDVRFASPANVWHLYDDDLPLRRALIQAGFDEVDQLGGVLRVYRRRGGPRTARDRLRSALTVGPARQVARSARHAGGAVLRRLAREAVRPTPASGRTLP